ncbi:MAG TPA: hypothetical protein VK850_11185, partial [Candidatus Binatia bacterium]|nr:hypothetical protein [Candidatus Binatia bacterium]
RNAGKRKEATRSRIANRSPKNCVYISPMRATRTDIGARTAGPRERARRYWRVYPFRFWNLELLLECNDASEPPATMQRGSFPLLDVIWSCLVLFGVIWSKKLFLTHCNVRRRQPPNVDEPPPFLTFNYDDDLS